MRNLKLENSLVMDILVIGFNIVMKSEQTLLPF